jgi:hypothetical protein
MKHRQKSDRAKERGFLILNILVSLAVISVLGVGIATTTSQMFKESARATMITEAVQQVENAGYWVSHDCLMAQSVTPDEGSGFPLVLKWITWGDLVIQVTYTLSGDKLLRNLSINGEPPQQMRVAEKINADPLKTNCQFDGSILTFKVTATIDLTSITRTYQIKIRTESTSY